MNRNLRKCTKENQWNIKCSFREMYLRTEMRTNKVKIKKCSFYDTYKNNLKRGSVPKNSACVSVLWEYLSTRHKQQISDQSGSQENLTTLWYDRFAYDTKCYLHWKHQAFFSLLILLRRGDLSLRFWNLGSQLPITVRGGAQGLSRMKDGQILLKISAPLSLMKAFQEYYFQPDPSRWTVPFNR